MYCAVVEVYPMSLTKAGQKYEIAPAPTRVMDPGTSTHVRQFESASSKSTNMGLFGGLESRRSVIPSWRSRC